MKKLFATGIIYIVLFVLLVIGVYNTGRQINNTVPESEETVASTEETPAVTEPPEDVKDKMEDKVVVKGDISKDVTPFNYKTTADKYLLDLCYAGLCEMKDRKCISENITSTYNKRKDTTTYHITLSEDATSASGGSITADDILFNYYLRADTGYTQDGSIAGLPITGLQEYRYGTKNIKAIKKKIAKKLEKPDKRTAMLIRNNIIKPVLEEEFEWVCSLYGQEMYDYITDKYPRKKDLFVYFFAYGTNYKTKGKNVRKVINDVIKSYGTNYNRLGKITGENYRKKAENIALYSIQTDKKFRYHVKNISGIRKLDNQTIEITIKGKRKAGFINRIGSLYIVPMKAWGNTMLFDGTSRFGFRRGRADGILKGKPIAGDETGNYQIKEVKDGIYTLEKRGLKDL